MCDLGNVSSIQSINYSTSVKAQRLSVKPSLSYLNIAKHLGLTNGGDKQLLVGIKALLTHHKLNLSVNKMGLDDLVETVGQYIFNKQSNNKLDETDLIIVRNMYLLLKVVRKTSSNTKSISLFCNFERTNRYSYGPDCLLSIGHQAANNRAEKPETAWTSYFKDVLAFESGKRGAGEFKLDQMFPDMNSAFDYVKTPSTESTLNSDKRNSGLIQYIDDDGEIIQRKKSPLSLDKPKNGFANPKVLPGFKGYVKIEPNYSESICSDLSDDDDSSPIIQKNVSNTRVYRSGNHSIHSRSSHSTGTASTDTLFFNIDQSIGRHAHYVDHNITDNGESTADSFFRPFSNIGENLISHFNDVTQEKQDDISSNRANSQSEFMKFGADEHEEFDDFNVVAFSNSVNSPSGSMTTLETQSTEKNNDKTSAPLIHNASICNSNRSSSSSMTTTDSEVTAVSIPSLPRRFVNKEAGNQEERRNTLGSFLNYLYARSSKDKDDTPFTLDDPLPQKYSLKSVDLHIGAKIKGRKKNSILPDNSNSCIITN